MAFLVDFPKEVTMNYYNFFLEIYTVLSTYLKVGPAYITISGGILVRIPAKVIVGFFFQFLSQFSFCDFGDKIWSGWPVILGPKCKWVGKCTIKRNKM